MSAERGAYRESADRGRPPCQEVDLAALPIQTSWPGEPVPLITWPLVVTKGPSERREDDFKLGIYRVQVTAGIRL